MNNTDLSFIYGILSQIDECIYECRNYNSRTEESEDIINEFIDTFESLKDAVESTIKENN